MFVRHDVKSWVCLAVTWRDKIFCVYKVYNEIIDVALYVHLRKLLFILLENHALVSSMNDFERYVEEELKTIHINPRRERERELFLLKISLIIEPCERELFLDFAEEP